MNKANWIRRIRLFQNGMDRHAGREQIAAVERHHNRNGPPHRKSTSSISI